jgi:hypothetical protein
VKIVFVAAGALLLAVTVAPPCAAQSPSPTRLTLELQDYAALPVTADNTDANTRGQLARVNYLRDEPGGRRFFVNDLNGVLYLLDKQTKTFTKYLDFNGLAGHNGLFPKFTYARNFATGLTNVILDPDYARNGVFYTLHMEDPSTPGPSAAPRSGIVPGLDLTGYTTTPAVPTPTVNGQIDQCLGAGERRSAEARASCQPRAGFRAPPGPPSRRRRGPVEATAEIRVARSKRGYRHHRSAGWNRDSRRTRTGPRWRRGRRGSARSSLRRLRDPRGPHARASGGHRYHGSDCVRG